MVACAAPIKTTTQKEAKTYTFGIPEGFSVTSVNGTTVVLSYDYNGAVDAGYNIYYGDTAELKGIASLSPPPIHTDGNVVTVGNLPAGKVTYFAVSALKSDGEESKKTSVLSITPVALAAGEKQHTLSAHIEACVSVLDKITFKEGKMFLSSHQEGTEYPGQGNDCSIDGIRLHTTEHIQIDKNKDGDIDNYDDGNPLDEDYNIDRVIPILSDTPWAPMNENAALDLTIYKIVTTKPMLITKLDAISKNCVSIGTNKVEAKLENDSAGVPNTVVMDASNCNSEDGMNFVDGEKGVINFTMTYTAADAE